MAAHRRHDLRSNGCARYRRSLRRRSRTRADFEPYPYSCSWYRRDSSSDTFDRNGNAFSLANAYAGRNDNSFSLANAHADRNGNSFSLANAHADRNGNSFSLANAHAVTYAGTRPV